jgi:Uma2 family endonuclease
MFDRTGKFSRYRQIASLRHYLLVAQDATSVEHFARQPDNQWLWSMAESPTDTISLTAVGCTFTLADIYANIPLA